MMARIDLLYHLAKQSLVEIEQRTYLGVRRQSVFVFVTLTQFDGVGNIVNYFNKT